MLDALTDPWAQEAVRLAAAEVALLGVVGGALGCWIVLYGLSYSAESLAHGLFPGLVLAALLGVPILVGGAVGVVVAALSIALAARAPQIGRDTAIAVVVTSLFGLGVLLALSASTPPGLNALLFGDVLGVAPGDVAIAAVLAVVVLAALRLAHGQLLAVGFDRGAARGLGARPFLADAILLVLIAAAVLVAVQGLGNLLVVAVLVAPAATARLLADRLVPMMAVATGVAVAAGFAGLYLSYHAETAAGASIAAVMVAAYVIVAAGKRLAGQRRRPTVHVTGGPGTPPAA
jgi:ABC-type Mn2+/Zn2+ transport system permease subunit